MTVIIYEVQGQQLQLGMMMTGKYVGVDRAVHWDGKAESVEGVTIQTPERW